MAKAKNTEIKITSAVVLGGQIAKPGSRCFVDDKTARDLMRRGKAELLSIVADHDEIPAFEDLKVTELRDVADEHGIEGAANMKRAELIEAIRSAEGED